MGNTTRPSGTTRARALGAPRTSGGASAADRSFTDVAISRFLGMQLVHRGDDTSEVRMPVSARYLQEVGVVQGGILSALADSAAVHALLAGLEPGRSPTGIEFKMNFLRAATADGGDLVARARALR